MRHHNPKRFIITAVAAIAVAGAALLPGVASADGGPKPRPQGPAVNGSVFEKDQIPPFGRAPTRIVDAADYVL